MSQQLALSQSSQNSSENARQAVIREVQNKRNSSSDFKIGEVIEEEKEEHKNN